MQRSIAPTTRLLAATLVDWTGTGFYVAISAIFLKRSVGLTTGEIGLVLAFAGAVAFLGSVPLGRLGDRFGHREALVGLHLARALAFTALLTAPGIAGTLVLLSAIALGDQAAASITQALAGQLVAAERRVAFMSRLRTVVNIGITLGTLPAGLALAMSTTSFAPLLAANAVSYVLTAIVVLSLPGVPTRATGHRRVRRLTPSAATTGLIAIDGLMSLWQTMRNVGLPLWVLQATRASPALVAILYATNTVLAVALQQRAGRHVDSFRAAVSAQRAVGGLLAASCVLLALSATGGRTWATAALLLAVLSLSFGELLKAAANWQITFTLAPAGRDAEFFATYGLGRIACGTVGPLLITGGVLALGAAGWLLLAGIFIVGGALTPPLARRAHSRPTRPPSRDSPPPRSHAITQHGPRPALA